MGRIRTLALAVLAGSLATASAGCVSDNRRATDAGFPPPRVDSGIVVTGPDSGFPRPTDAGFVPGVDSGPPRIDAGRDAGGIVFADSGPRDSGTGVCGTLTSLSPLPSSCTPRCSSSTYSYITTTCAGGDSTCVQNALAADTTPPANVMLPDGPVPYDCKDCSDHQSLTCYGDYCPTELNEYLACDPDFSDCSSQTTALNDCLDLNDAAVTTCLNARVLDCFP